MNATADIDFIDRDIRDRSCTFSEIEVLDGAFYNLQNKAFVVFKCSFVDALIISYIFPGH